MYASAAFIDGFFYVTPENYYNRGPLYPLLLLPLIAILLVNLAGTLLRRKQLSRKVFLAFLIAELPFTVALILQLFFEISSLADISFVLSGIAMFSFILSDQIEQDRMHQREIAEQQREIAHQRTNILALQMRPHFIYNTLMSIYGLCRLDPGKARQVVMDFANYLRRNFQAIASDSAIPFSTELEHTRAYLAIEQVQYDDMLVVDYDTTFTHFRLPPLTLQPIVENAIKHGMDTDSDPLRLSIRTRHTDFGAEVIVEDNGPGFDPAGTKEPGIALGNIRQRLEMMCGGSLTITPGDGGGTVVTITIPDSAEQ
jgi:LytS/YehU family sensor histidine kinase